MYKRKDTFPFSCLRLPISGCIYDIKKWNEFLQNSYLILFLCVKSYTHFLIAYKVTDDGWPNVWWYLFFFFMSPKAKRTDTTRNSVSLNINGISNIFRHRTDKYIIEFEWHNYFNCSVNIFICYMILSCNIYFKPKTGTNILLKQ